MTILVYALIAWACLVAATTATDTYFMYRNLSGRAGGAVRALTHVYAEEAGGVRKWVLISLAHDILMPWIVWYGLWTVRRAERD